jgi:hypothetical protein
MYIKIILAALCIMVAFSVLYVVSKEEETSAQRDAKRLSDVSILVNALHEYAAHNEGSFPGGLSEDELEICREGAASCEELYDLSTLKPKYITAIPQDPQCPEHDANCSQNGTGYFASLVKGRVIIAAYGAEDDHISVTR